MATERGLASLRRVRRIVDGLLEFARAGASPERGAAADLGAVIDDVIEGAQPEAVEDRVSLRVEPFETCWVACSAGVLTSICANLVYNAIRHMKDASERIVIVRARSRDGRLRVEVDDTGPGVAAGLEKTLFEPFVREQTRGPGVGLGLATVKRLVQGHGGQVGFAAKPAGGTLFWFELEVVAAGTTRTSARDAGPRERHERWQPAG